MNVTRILLVDDHTILRAGLRSLLSAYPDFDVVGEAGDGEDALALVGRLKPDVVIMDIAMPRVNGLVATRLIMQAYPNTRILILTQYDSKDYVLPLLYAGAAGYVLKQTVDTELVTAIRAVAEGESFLYPPVAKLVLAAYLQGAAAKSHDPYEHLTQREREVLIMVAQGRSSREIASLLHLSPNTVDVHRSRMMQKLDLHGIAGVSAYAVRRGLTGK
jgi:DNA-binding NarL/FixJ family response regulator